MAQTVKLNDKSYKRVRTLIAQKGLTQESIAANIVASRASVQKVLARKPIKTDTFREVIEYLDLEYDECVDWDDFYNRHGVASREKEGNSLQKLIKPQVPERIGNWHIDEKLTSWKAVSNGLEYRFYRLRHRHRHEFARGKCYSLEHLSTEERTDIPTKIDRHCKVVDRLNYNAVEGVPIKRDAFPYPDDESKTRQWWIIEQWFDGVTLADCLEKNRLTKREMLKFARRLLLTLHELHKLDIVVRDLSPESILIREPDNYPIILDFELAKLFSTTSTVSNPSLSGNPFRAPELEVGASNPKPQADFYSWAMIVLAVALEKPVPTREDIELCSSLFRPELFQEIRRCLSCIPENRSENAQVILDTFPIIPPFLRLA